ncbi:hypothetical protein [Halorubrum sp. DTA98]|uniref:hypothetical protein n=1 Tax=Halorubrum sp. DTA98 TaxID=3402163 RepID=UPI003AADEDF9
MLTDYANLRTLPAAIGIVFAVASIYLFGGIAGLTIEWGINYTLTTGHALWVSLAAYVLAFASSETRSFDHYEQWEQVAIVGGPAVMIAYQHWTWFNDLIVTNEPHLAILAFLVSFASYAVLVQ